MPPGGLHGQSRMQRAAAANSHGLHHRHRRGHRHRSCRPDPSRLLAMPFQVCAGILAWLIMQSTFDRREPCPIPNLLGPSSQDPLSSIEWLISTIICAAASLCGCTSSSPGSYCRQPCGIRLSSGLPDLKLPDPNPGEMAFALKRTPQTMGGGTLVGSSHRAKPQHQAEGSLAA